MRWYHALSKQQQTILIVLAVAVLATFGVMGWTVWSTIRGYVQQSPLATPALSPYATPTPPPSPIETSTPSPTPIPTFDVSQAGLVAADVVDARGLRLRLGVPLTLVSEYELSVVLYQTYVDNPPLLNRERDLLDILHLDSGISRIDPVSQAAKTAAIYFPDSQELYLRRDWDGDQHQLQIQLAYAYARALSDQSGNLPATIPDAFTLDQKIALNAVKDGNAIFTLWQYLELAPNATEAQDVAQIISTLYTPVWRGPAPRHASLNQLTFALGAKMAREQFNDGGVPALNAIMERPPRSTEHLLDVAMYAEDDLPVNVPALAPPLDTRSPGAGWTEIRAETLGSALSGWVFSEWQYQSYAMSPASGWGGDLLQIWENEDGDYAAAWHLTFDSAAIASENYQMLLDLMPGKLLPGIINDTTPASDIARGRWWSGGQGAVFLRRYAKDIWLIWGSNSEFVEYLAANL